MSLLPVTLDARRRPAEGQRSRRRGGETGGEVWLFGLIKAATVAIGRGENKGRTITYHNVVRRWVKLGDWTGKANTWSMPVQKLKGKASTKRP